MDKKQNIAILGSTGSIGTQTLDIVRENPDKFRASVLTARRNWRLLAEQALAFLPDLVVIADTEYEADLRSALSGTDIEVASGADAIALAAQREDVDIVLNALVGFSGMIPTIHAVKSGKRLALANKESLVVAGELITDLLKESNSELLPVDSEHSAIFQCLMGENREAAKKIILTASGGPFRKRPKERMEEITVQDALNHPNWSMGHKVTIDSATMMNKGFEMIEARWIFDFNPKDIEIVVHPQSIVHSMVEFCDGSIKAQLGVPDMRIPISLALGYPQRIPSARPGLTLRQYAELTFEAPDIDKFPMIALAYEALERGGNMPCILNAANELAVEAFLNGRLRFVDIPIFVRKVMDSCAFSAAFDLDTLINSNNEAIDNGRIILNSYNL